MAKATYTFKFPKSVTDVVEWNPTNQGFREKWPEMPKTVALMALTADQELQASKVGKFDMMAQRYDAVKRAITQLDGKSVSYTDGETDIFWQLCGPKARTLLLQAYDKIHGTEDAEDADFFGSMDVKV